MEKDPITYGWLTYAWVLGISALAGFVSFINRVRQHPITNVVMEFVGEITTSAFVGLVTFLGCESANIGATTTAVLVAISAHMGTRSLYLAELYVRKRLAHLFGEGH